MVNRVCSGSWCVGCVWKFVMGSCGRSCFCNVCGLGLVDVGCLVVGVFLVVSCWVVGCLGWWCFFVFVWWCICCCGCCW